MSADEQNRLALSRDEEIREAERALAVAAKDYHRAFSALPQGFLFFPQAEEALRQALADLDAVREKTS